MGGLLSFHLYRPGSRPRQGGGRYLVDLVLALPEARTAEDAFQLQLEIGDQALFLAGVFPDWIWHRRVYGRRPVDLEYYESMGSRWYGMAARTPTAARLDLEEVLGYMADRFPRLRQALNDLVDEHLHLSRRPATIDGLTRQAFYRIRN